MHTSAHTVTWYGKSGVQLRKTKWNETNKFRVWWSSLNYVFFLDLTQYSEKKCNLILRCFAGNCCLEDWRWRWKCSSEMCGLESSHEKDAGCAFLTVEFQRIFCHCFLRRCHHWIGWRMTRCHRGMDGGWPSCHLNAFSHKRCSWICPRKAWIQKFSNRIWHGFELVECRSVAVTLNTCFALVTSYRFYVPTLIICCW